MSRRLSSSQQRPRVHQPTPDNPYKITTISSLPAPTHFTQLQPQNATQSQCTKDNLQNHRGNLLRGGGHSNNLAAYDTAISTDTISYYDIHNNYGYQYTACRNEPKHTDCMYSDNSDSTQVPYYYNCEDVSSTRRFSRNNHSDRSFGCNNKNVGNFCRDSKVQLSLSKDPRKIFPKHETPTFRGRLNDALPTLHIAVPLPRLSERPQSSLSSGVTSAIVDGCGGHCQTFENVCYYFLQVAFTMGILIGTSLSIAGAVLRKSAARNLQVLVYIGALLSMVSALLLAIQCSARYSARKRKKALRNAKRAPIPLDTLGSRSGAFQIHQPLMDDGRNAQRLEMHPQPQRSAITECQGIPWWRRKDLN